MRCVLNIHLCLLLVLNLCSAKETITSSCQRDCGGISIIYPFGIGKGCYLNEWYEVNCNRSTSGALVPFLSKMNKELVQIDLPRPVNRMDESVPLGSLRIKTSIASIGCSGGDKDKSEELFNFTGTPFLIDDKNTLLAVGCNIHAEFTHVDTKLVGCISSYCKRFAFVTWGECNGYGCCNANLPEMFGPRNVVGVRINRYDRNITRGGCGVAFLTDEYDQMSPLPSNTSAQRLYAGKYAVTHLKWQVITTNLSFTESLGCGENLDDFYYKPCSCYSVVENNITSTQRCACTHGYKGNPYRPNGCKDIDECKEFENGRPYNCTNGGTCQNIPGSYRCVIKKSQTFLIYIGIAMGLLLILLVVWSIKQKIKHMKEVELRQKFFDQNGGGILIQRLSGEGTSNVDVKIFSEKDMKEATNGYDESRILGQGGQGTVYKGILPDNSLVAIKKSRLEDSSLAGQFINEVLVLSQINHRNVVKLLGCCLETEVPFLVYEFISSGTLFDRLHSLMFESPLTWEHRLRIAIEVAGTLAYLHSSASIPIIHRDVKTANILLDDNLSVKVADFGASRLIPMDQEQLKTMVQGTIGYLDPEYYNTGMLNDKSDVYSFGVVLMELLSGQKALCCERPQTSKHLASYFASAMREKRLHEIIDGQVINEDNQWVVQEAARIAVKCTRLMREERPKMKEVAAELEALQVKITTKDKWLDQYPEETEHWLDDHLLSPKDHTSTAHGSMSASRLYRGQTL